MFAAGLVMTWCGMVDGPGKFVHEALEKLLKDSRDDAQNLASISVPPWSFVPRDTKEKLKTKGGKVELEPRFHTSGILGEKVSTAATHFLLLDNGQSDGEEDEKARLIDCRHFQRDVIEAMDNFKENKDMLAVYILMGGSVNALKMVKSALESESNIPVLIMKGTGGIADVLADVYMKAELESTKKRDENGKVRTRTTKLPGEAGAHYLKEFKKSGRKDIVRLLEGIFVHLDRLTIYDPILTVQSLDSTIFEGLFKHKQTEKILWLVEVMKKLRKTFRRSTSTSDPDGFIDSSVVQMDFCIEAMKQNNVEIVKMFLDKLPLSFNQHFHLGRILRLYTVDTNTELKMIDIRKKMQRLLKKLTVFPLRCLCEECCSCTVSTNNRSPEAELEVQRTCLHPIQELFLWSIDAQQTDLAVVFWKLCDDKIAAALVAQAVFHSKKKQSSDPDVRWQIQEDENRFQELAIHTLKSCHEMDEIQTESLLTKPCPWWGGVSVLQLAIMTENRAFMAQSACKSIMTRIWRGDPPSDKYRDQRPTRLVDVKPSTGCCGTWECCPPQRKYYVNLVLQVIFLVLFSYTLLSDFGRIVMPTFITLIIWVASITVEEIRQLVARNPVTSEVRLSRQRQPMLRKWKAYSSQNWNRVDMVTISLFWLGLLVFAPNDVLHTIGRVLLSVDVFCFFMRTFQMLMVFDDLGLLLVMVYKMAKDTKNFMIILLVFVVAYSVASEALLYPGSDFTWARFFHLPRKAYWQVFGELFLEEIEPIEAGSCTSGNDSMHYGGDKPHCPTEYGSYIVPILMGIYIMITNVLLLNLLIARFNVTFNKVHDEAVQYQSWHRCDIITEFYTRTSLPPPLNILHFVIMACRRMVRDICKACQSRSKEGCSACCAKGGGDGQDTYPLLPHNPGKVVFTRSADGRSIDVFWDKTSVKSKSCPWLSRKELYTVKVTESGSDAAAPTEEFYVGKGENCDKFALSVWDQKRDLHYTVKVEDREAEEILNTTATRDPECLCEIRQFEEEQAAWVLKQSDENVMRDLKKDSDLMKHDLKQLGEGTNNVLRQLEEGSENVRTQLTTLESSLMEFQGNISNEKKAVRGKLQKITEFINGNNKEMHDAAVKATAEAQKAREDAKCAEEARQEALVKLEKVQKDAALTSQHLHDCKRQLEEAQLDVRDAREEMVQQMKEMKQTLDEAKRSAALREDELKQMLLLIMEKMQGIQSQLDRVSDSQADAPSS
nr:hypothetical protein BaRGS_031169 [Batillaria attramentaria]